MVLPQSLPKPVTAAFVKSVLRFIHRKILAFDWTIFTIWPGFRKEDRVFHKQYLKRKLQQLSCRRSL